MNVAENFIAEFHNLDGILLKEKKKSLFLLLKKYESRISKSDVLDEIILKLVPTSYLEEVYILEFLIFFCHSQELLKMIKTGNDIFKSKILKQKWFVQEVLLNLTPNQLVNELLPTISYSVRLKILKTLAKRLRDEKKVDNIFDLLQQTYGFYSALVLLPACSIDKIKNILSENHLKISPSMLKSLLKKDIELVPFYMKKYKEASGNFEIFDENPIFNKVALTRPDLFLEIVEVYDFKINKSGRRTTKAILNYNKDIILSNPNKYITLLRTETLVRTLGNDFPVFLKRGFPATIDLLLHSPMKFILKHYPKKKRLQLFRETFESVYNENLRNYEYLIDRYIDMLGLASGEERNRWVESSKNPAELLQFYTIDKSVGMLQNAIHLSETLVERRNRINLLIDTCKINDDYEALLKVLEYFCKRHRNSEAMIINSFLNNIHLELDLKKCTPQHWEYIYEILTVQFVKKQRFCVPILLKYMEFLHKSGKPFEEFVLIYLENDESFYVTKKASLDPAFKEQLLKQIINSIPDVKDEKLVKQLSIPIVDVVRGWNQKYPKKSLSVHHQPRLLKLVEDEIRSVRHIYNKTDMNRVLHYMICTQNGEVGVDNFEKLYWEKFPYMQDVSAIKWFLKYKPAILKDNIHSLECLIRLKLCPRYLNYIKKYSHINLPQLAIAFYEERVKHPDVKYPMTCFSILALLMPSSDYINLQKTYYPTCDKLDILSATQEEKKFYADQCAVSKAIRYIHNIEMASEDILQYCKKDYLGTALSPLYSLADHVAENKVHAILKELNKRAVAVRKHALFLASKILPTESVLKQFILARDTEKNVSIQKHLFSSCYKYFLKNGTDRSWVLLEHFIKGLSHTDSSAIKVLIKVGVFPRSFRAEYILTVWEVLLKNEANGSKMEGYIDSFLDAISNEDIVIVPWEIFVCVIETKLFEDCTISKSTVKFAIKFLMYTNQTDDALKLIFGILGNFKIKYWQSEENYTEVRKIVYNLCNDIYSNIMPRRRNNEITYASDLPQLLANCWGRHFTVAETFEEHLMLDFMVLKQECQDDLQVLAQKLSSLLTQYQHLYGDLILGSFKMFLPTALRYLVDRDGIIYNHQLTLFLHLLLQEGSSDFHCLLIIDLLPERINDKKTIRLYDEMIRVFREKQHTVEIALNARLKKVQCSSVEKKLFPDGFRVTIAGLDVRTSSLP